jgi:hypothetical protein
MKPKHAALVLTMVIGQLAFAGVARPPSVPRAAEEAVLRFGRTVLSPNGFSYWDFEGKVRARMLPLISKRLLTTVDNVRDCGRDWASHQPANSTDKPPFVDCCVFSASADWPPTSFVVQKAESLSDGRYRFTVEYQYDSDREHDRWHVAMYVARENNRYVVDDFEGGLDDPESEHWFVLGEPPQCSSGKWVDRY